MKFVPRFEAGMLHLLQCFLRRSPVEQALPIIKSGQEEPKKLSPQVVELVKDHLSKGVVLLLARTGGWRSERFLRDGHIVSGRLWERTPPEEMGLVFSKSVLKFLVWLTANNPTEDKCKKWKMDSDMTPADELFFYLVYSRLRGLEGLSGLPGIVDNRLCRLAFPEDWPAVAIVPYTDWVGGLGAVVLEALQHELAGHWIRAEMSKGQITDWNHLKSHGLCQAQVLEAFLDDVEKAHRYDLARFVLMAASKLVHRGSTTEQWVNAKASTGIRLADKVETYRAALSLVNCMERLRRWEQQARSVGYLDEGYETSQLVKADWEQWGGEQVATEARRLIGEMDPLKVNDNAINQS